MYEDFQSGLETLVLIRLQRTSGCFTRRFILFHLGAAADDADLNTQTETSGSQAQLLTRSCSTYLTDANALVLFKNKNKSARTRATPRLQTKKRQHL